MSNEPGLSTLVLVIIAVLLPPLAVYLKEGAGTALIIGIVLWLLFYIPGLLYALYLILK
jgi:uncharacterized membrane protein YqaE (UPF0057 family)